MTVVQTKEEKAQSLYEQQERLSELEQTRLTVNERLVLFLEETRGEVTPEVEELADSLLLLDSLIEEKVAAYCHSLERMEYEQKRLAARAAALKQRSKGIEATVERWKERLKEFIERNVEPDAKGIRRVDAGDFKVRVQRNSSQPVVIDEVAAETLPRRYQKVVVDESAIRQAVHNGAQLSFARLGERGSHLRIS